MPISGECEAWIHKQSQGFFLKGNWVREKKMSGLGPKEMDRTLWAVFGQEPS